MTYYQELKHFIDKLPQPWQIYDYLDPINTIKNKFNSNEYPIINISNDLEFSTTQDIVNEIEKIYDKFLILSGNLQYWYKPTNNIVYFPWFLYTTSSDNFDTNLIKNSQRKYLVSCLNGRSRPHRVENFVKMSTKSWFDKTYYTIFNNYNHEHEGNETEVQYANKNILPTFLNLVKDKPSSYPSVMTVSDPAWHNSYISLITDASVSNSSYFISEKTYKPLKCGMIPLYITGVEIVKFLREIGFDMFDDIIDHSYDTESDWHKRIDMVHDQIDKVSGYDWPKIYEDTLERRLANSKLFYSEDLLKKLTKHITLDTSLPNINISQPKIVEHKKYWNFIENSISFWNLFDFEKTKKFDMDTDKIKSGIKNDKLIIDLSNCPYNDTTEKIVPELSKTFDDFLILTGDVKYLNNALDKAAYFPYCYLQSHDHKPSPLLVANSYRHYPISCLNGRSRPHRVENFVKLVKKPWFNKLRFSMYNNFDEAQEKTERPGLHFCDDTILPTYLSLCDRLPEKYPIDYSVQDEAYHNSYINLVTETTVNTIDLYVSEKSWKPFRAGQMPIFLGNPTLVNFFRELGFDVFDDIIDHSYDFEDDWHKRIDMIHEQLDTIVDYNWKKIFKDTEERRLANYNLFYSQELLDKLTAQLDYDHWIGNNN